MIQNSPCHHDAKRTHVTEVGQAHAARWMLLAENDVSTRAIEGAPSRHSALYCPTNSSRHLRMPPADLLEDRYGPDARCALKDGKDLSLPQGNQWIGTTTSTWRSLLGW